MCVWVPVRMLTRGGTPRFVGLSTSGLNVIGGDTVNLVGLGGCLADSAF